MDAYQCGVTTPPDGRQPEKGRSKLSNSLFAVHGLSGNSKAGRRFRDVCKAALVELGVSEAELSELQRDQVRSLALLQLRLDDLQAEAFNGKASSDLDLAIVRVSNSIARARWMLGIGPRRRQDLGPTDLGQYLEGKRSAP
jgi:hypothetical protein